MNLVKGQFSESKEIDAKKVVIFHDKGVMKLTCTNYIIILEKKIFKRTHQKSRYFCLGAPRSHIFGCGIAPPPE